MTSLQLLPIRSGKLCSRSQTLSMVNVRLQRVAICRNHRQRNNMMAFARGETGDDWACTPETLEWFSIEVNKAY